jgi:predicted aldo/keto reductase-like oxidoreductase
MTERREAKSESLNISRRSFLAAGGAAVAGAAVPVSAGAQLVEPDGARIKSYRTLGRTGFKVSDISMGGAASDANVVRFAYDSGINYIDTAESYGNGENERMIGEAMQFMDRKKLFITTKLQVKEETTEKEILDRFAKCLGRMKTEYADALYMHSVTNTAMIDHAGFHAAIKKLKADGRVRHAGISSHGPRGEGDSMEKVLCMAAEDGRFDLMLLVYNFMNFEEGEKILAACKKHNVGTTAMKTAPGAVKPDPFDPENPSEDYAKYLKNMEEGGMSHEDAVARIEGWIKEQEESYDKTKPFREKHKITEHQQLRAHAVQWVLGNPDMHTVCLSLDDFAGIHSHVALSGSKLARAGEAMLDDYRLAYNGLYCRHGCNQCVAACAHNLPVSTIMRYSYYFVGQGREKLAMSKYSRLDGANGALCLTCDGQCGGACPHGVSIRANLLAAHKLLTLA